jgi:ACR3 family arsenite transporter
MRGEVKRMNVFERYLSLWVALCMVLGVALGRVLPEAVGALRGLEFGEGSQINIPIAVLIWLMIYPMMLRIDFASIRNVGRRPKGLVITLVVNWLVKPFSMALLGWVFFRHVFAPLIGPELASEYIAGVIILAAAPCTAMVFVWSYLSDGDPAYTLVQVSVNDLIMLVAFAPIVKLLVSGASGLEVPFEVLLYSVGIFVVIPLAAGALSRRAPRPGRVVRRKSFRSTRDRARPPRHLVASSRSSRRTSPPGGSTSSSSPSRS